ncbi:MAG TPA: DNA-directed RNA polymerase subunit beta [Longimicrobium sp.]|nr:DNA-directed RNA polymerase subunit beta [Longimicrobium sp.]HSU14006.1 DNA-directed RNA polymerase subunit beta [Longimicrobium sp.]
MATVNKPIVSFGKLVAGMDHPNLLDVQLRAFETLLQTDAAAREREDVGLERVFNEIFPISDVNGNFSLEYVRYALGEPKYDMEECMERDMTYAAPLKATLRLVVWEDIGDERRPKDIIEKEVYLGDLPVLTPLGTFIINGAERVIVSQLHRSPGVVFEETTHPNGSKLFSARIIPFRGSWVEFTIDIHDVVAVHIDKKKKFPATALLRTVGYSRDADILSVFFNRDTVALASLAGEGTREGRRGEVFHGFLAADVPDPAVLGPEGPRLYRDVVVPGTGEVFERGSRLTPAAYRALTEGGVYSLPVIASALLARAGDEVNAEVIGRLQRAGIESVQLFRTQGQTGTSLRATLAKDPTRGTLDSLFAIHNLVRPGTAPAPDVWTEDEYFEGGDTIMHVADFLRAWSERDSAPSDPSSREAQRSAEERMLRYAQERGIRYVWENFREERAEKTARPSRVLVYELNRVVQVYSQVWRLLFQPRATLVVSGDLADGGSATARSDYSEYLEETLNKRYDLGRVGRYKINQRLSDAFRSLDFAVPPAGMTALTAQDVLAILYNLVELHEGRGYTDDIDHLGNRRVRSVGELIANQFSVGLSRMARLVRERMSIVSDPDKINIDDLVNARTVSAVIQQFFGSSQLSQFMDQTNPLAEMTHKRRLSALGPGGLTRERAGFEVRDVHYSHYGRMCPIETPEGPNIGLINSLTTYSRINDLGFIETPYRKVVRAVVQYPATVKLDDAVRLVLGERSKVFAKKGEEVDAARGREVFRAMIVGAELAEDVLDWTPLFPRMLAGEIPQPEWDAAFVTLTVLARRGERVTEELADRIAAQPVNLVRVVSRRAGAAARGVAPEAIRNPASLPVRVFAPKSAAVLAVPGTVLTPEVVDAIHARQMEGLAPADFGDTPDEVALDFVTGVAALSPEGDVGRIPVGTKAPVIHVTPVVTRITAWLSANEEENARIAQANAPLGPDFTFTNEFILCRERGDFPLLRPDEIDFMDVAPDQLVSIAAALIPFLEHDDANRALMGSNMQRQAVPLLFPDAPLVGTGLEHVIAVDSGAVVVARRGGVVKEVTADHIVVDAGGEGLTGDEPLRRLAQFDRYRMKKYWRTNQDTALNQRPLVFPGQQVKKGDVLADGASTDGGELALGRNLLVAFMPWYGNNFEDAIILSDRLVRDDVYTSIHIQELELQVRDTKRGMEEITREIPNVAEESLVDLDERGVVRIGARVKAGDILVGKITPKGETELSPEEKLLTAIFGEKAKDVKDSSLKVPPGVEGTVIDVKIFSRRIDDPILEKERGQKIGELRTFERNEIQRIGEARDEEVKELIRGKEAALFLKKGTVEPYFNEGTVLSDEVVDALDLGEVDLTTLKVTDRATNEQLRRLIDESKRRIERVRQKTENQIDKVFQPDELPPGVVQLVKVYLAEKRKISVGDKMAGRHGNKGIIARIVPAEDMPVMPDGTPVDVCLNPLGVPSRMNVGQILETHLGWASRVLGFESKTPVFQGASEDEIGVLIRLAGVVWAGRALGVTAQPPTFTVDDVRAIAHAAHALEEGSEPEPRPEIGIGRPVDRLLVGDRVPAEVREKLAPLPAYLVAAAREVAAMKEADFETLYPAAAALAAAGGKPKAGDTLVNAALEEHMAAAGLTPGGKVWMRDGRSGNTFESPVTIGAIYMLKLSHLVDDKIHARSIGPYSLVTQQPLAGKAQFGGQRFGEMEVWALEAYGAAHTLQEILTVKSDDVNGRSRVYEAIVKGENLPEPGLPESFNVLVKELQALGISVTLGS